MPVPRQDKPEVNRTRVFRFRTLGPASPLALFSLIGSTSRAKGVPKSAAGGKKGGKKTEDRILDLLAQNPKLTFAGMVAALGISRSAIQKHVEHLKDAQRLRRIGPDKGGRWEVAFLAENTKRCSPRGSRAKGL